MAVSVSMFLGFFLGFVLVGLVSSAKFDELFQPSWAMDHFAYEGELLKLKLDKYSGKSHLAFLKNQTFHAFCLKALFGLCCIPLNLYFLHLLLVYKLPLPVFKR